MPSERPLLRSRALFALLALLTVPAGLALRHTTLPLPRVLTREGGDTLYATLVYFLARVLLPAPDRRRCAALLAVAFCFAVEIGQLYRAPWILRIRETTLGGLILGHGFRTADLVAYVAGVATGLLVDRLLVDRLVERAFRGRVAD